MKNQQNSYKIRQVVDLTGVSEFLLRAWEDRYSAFKPARTKTGRRLYSEQDVLKIRTLLCLTRQGFRVGDIAQKKLDELTNLSLSHTSIITEKINPEVKAIISNANNFKWDTIRFFISEQKKKRKLLSWVNELIIPLLAEVGRQVESGQMSVAQEHIISAIIKDNLPTHQTRNLKLKKGPRIVIATPEGDHHDIGIMIAAHMASELKINTLYLGPHMPSKELAAVCIPYKATHLLLASTVAPENGAKDTYLNYLNFLDTNIDPKIKILLAGKNSLKYSVNLKRPFKIIDSFTTFNEEINKIR